MSLLPFLTASFDCIVYSVIATHKLTPTRCDAIGVFTDKRMVTIDSAITVLQSLAYTVTAWSVHLIMLVTLA